MFRTLFLISILSTLLYSCKKEESDTTTAGAFLEVKIANVVNNQPLQLKTNFVNPFNEAFQLTEYKYYISNIVLHNAKEAVAVPNTYYLINGAYDSTGRFKESIEADTYHAISFLIGIDSTKQVSGTRIGVFDPKHGLFWDPNLGYMAARLEGTSPSSGAPENSFRYHIGGFEGPSNTLRKVFIPIPGNLTLASGNTLQIGLKAEMLRWFDAIHRMPIKDNPSIVTLGPEANRIANNYSGMFSLTSVEIK